MAKNELHDFDLGTEINYLKRECKHLRNEYYDIKLQLREVCDYTLDALGYNTDFCKEVFSMQQKNLTGYANGTNFGKKGANQKN
ncbi:MAG: hypothetical protein FWG64_12905 [Firmicutes bacterium]|nr:hypothetical protein [Bacillota bacterium]